MKKREFSSQYLAKCQRKLQEWNAPLDDWDCMCVSDTKDDGASAYDSTCELCGCKNVRFIHEMYHEDYFEESMWDAFVLESWKGTSSQQETEKGK